MTTAPNSLIERAYTRTAPVSTPRSPSGRVMRAEGVPRGGAPAGCLLEPGVDSFERDAGAVDRKRRADEQHRGDDA